MKKTLIQFLVTLIILILVSYFIGKINLAWYIVGVTVQLINTYIGEYFNKKP